MYLKWLQEILMKFKKVILTILGIAFSLCYSVAQSAELEVGCGIVNYYKNIPKDKSGNVCYTNCDVKNGGTSTPYVEFYASIGEFNTDDFSEKGLTTVAITISGNDKSWTTSGQGNYEKNGKSIEFGSIKNKTYLPMSFAMLTDQFGTFMSVKCKTLY